MIVAAVTFKHDKMLAIVNHCAVFWHLIILQTQCFTTQTGLSGLCHRLSGT